jgi:hypothetical protein
MYLWMLMLHVRHTQDKIINVLRVNMLGILA